MAKQPKSRARERQHEARAPQHLLSLPEIDQLRSWGLRSLGGDFPVRRLAALVVTLLGTGARRFEAAALRCQDVRMGPGGPEVFFPEVKGGGTATVPISEETYQALLDWITYRMAFWNLSPSAARDKPLLPTTKGEFMHPATLWLTFKDALTEAEIRSLVGVHAARHASGFLLLRATGDLTKVQTFLRHSSLATTAAWYSHVHLPDLRAGLTKAGL